MNSFQTGFIKAAASCGLTQQEISWLCKLAGWHTSMPIAVSGALSGSRLSTSGSPSTVGSALAISPSTLNRLLSTKNTGTIDPRSYDEMKNALILLLQEREETQAELTRLQTRNR